MRKKQFVILMIILAAAIAAAFGMRAANEKKEKAEAEKQKEETVYACRFESEDVTEFSYQYEGATLEFKKSDDAWISENDEKLDLDEDQITTMLSTLSSITADSTIPNVEDLSEYGLDEPVQTLNLSFADGTTKELIFGMKNEIVGGRYVKVSGDDNVYLVDSTFTSSTMNKSLEDLEKIEEEGDDTADSAAEE